jgi:putative transposase
MFDGDLPAPATATTNAAPTPAPRGDLTQSPVTRRKKPEGAAYNAAELAEMKLPGYPGTERGIQMRAETENWPSQPRMTGSIGRRGVEYPLKSLPAALREMIIGRLTREIAPSVAEKAVAALDVAPAELADWQRDTRDARAAICAEAERLSITMGRGLKAACERIAAMLQAGEATADMAALARRANHKAGGETTRTLSARTIERWLQARAAGGVNALAPKNGGPQAVEPGWLPALLSLYRAPQKRTLKACLRDLPLHWTPTKGEKYPSETCAREWLGRMSAQSRNKGRMGPRALLALQAFKRRDTSMLAPLDVVMADGHTFRAMVAHPVTGKPFQPEVMAVIDAATRKVVGWSAGIAESTTVVMDGIRHAVVTHGVPSILYTDNGSGFVNEAVSDEITGFYARIGMTHERAQAYRAQARGLIERPNATLWRASARKLHSYCGRDMDREAGRIVARKIEKDIKGRGASPVMLGWDEFLAWLGGEVAAYNARPHRSLPIVAQGDKGAKRHMTPDEAWIAKTAEHHRLGWNLTTVSADEAADLFRPHLRRVCRRGEVKLPWGVYFAAALAPFHGEEVLVAYEVQDGSQVWVKNLDGRLICTAARGGNVTPFMPADKVSHARIKRAEGQAKRLAGKLADIREEAFGAGMITVTPMGAPALPVLELTAEEVEAADAEIAKLEARQKPQAPDGDERPNFGDDAAWAAWLLAAPHRATAADCAHLADLLNHRATRDWWRAEGLDLDALEEIAAQNQGIKAYA